MPRITVLATGGTIAGQASNRAAIGYDAGKVSGSDLVAAVPGLDHLATVSAEQNLLDWVAGHERRGLV